MLALNMGVRFALFYTIIYLFLQYKVRNILLAIALGLTIPVSCFQMLRYRRKQLSMLLESSRVKHIEA
jgi:hypothetical protein